ncbi:sulfotransferase family protein [Acuticoccus sediminis]|uniref:sulfotransferase family protein n=1 Tax=Acuticoccus sediminis TaxID=2184697 RepID=UPI001CFE362A|nr:sulfotransferase [Acuticoccus sediminis]
MADSNANLRRIFIGGVPRSGTTLIQSMLAAHPDVTTFPESHFFSTIVDDLDWKKFGLANGGRTRGGAAMARAGVARARRTMDIPSRRAEANIEKFLGRAGLEHHRHRFAENAGSIRGMTRAFVSTLDEAARGGAWVEKTPNHIFRTGLISALVDDAIFIHIVRNAEDTIASIKHAADRHEGWSHRYLRGADTVPRMVALWRRGVQCSLGKVGRPGHLVLYYDDVVREPHAAARAIAAHVGLDFTDAMLTPDTTSAVLSYETWKSNVSGPIQMAGSRFATVFTPEQQAEIRRRLATAPAPGDLARVIHTARPARSALAGQNLI